jgi:hypothetical protein
MVPHSSSHIVHAANTAHGPTVPHCSRPRRVYVVHALKTDHMPTGSHCLPPDTAPLHKPTPSTANRLTDHNPTLSASPTQSTGQWTPQYHIVYVVHANIEPTLPAPPTQTKFQHDHIVYVSIETTLSTPPSQPTCPRDHIVNASIEAALSTPSRHRPTFFTLNRFFFTILSLCSLLELFSLSSRHCRYVSNI